MPLEAPVTMAARSDMGPAPFLREAARYLGAWHGYANGGHPGRARAPGRALGGHRVGRRRGWREAGVGAQRTHPDDRGTRGAAARPEIHVASRPADGLARPGAPPGARPPRSQLPARAPPRRRGGAQAAGPARSEGPPARRLVVDLRRAGGRLLRPALAPAARRLRRLDLGQGAE